MTHSVVTHKALKRSGLPVPREGHRRLCYGCITIFRPIGSRYYWVAQPSQEEAK